MQQVGRIEDAAASGRYLLVGQSVDFVQKLAVPAAGIYHVRVAVAEARHHHPAASVYRFFAAAQNDRIHGPEGGNVPVLYPQPGILQRAGAPLLRAFHPKHPLRLDTHQPSYIIDKTHS